MSDKSLMDRWCWMMKIAPHDNHTSNKYSWSEKSNDLLSAEKKVYAIKISEKDQAEIDSNDQLIAAKKKKKRISVLKTRLKKWIELSQWKLPKAMILFSVLQLFFHLIGPMSLAYQTLAFSPIRRLELWRYFTYSLLHAGSAHLLINIILQLVIAFLLESEVGHMNVMFVYVFGVLSGSLAASVSPAFSLMVGASSGIYSLLMSHIPHIYMNFSSISHRTHRIIFVAALSISDVVYAVIHCLENREPQIAVRSHAAGALSGLLLGFIFYESHRQENRDEDLKFKIIKWTSLAIYLGFFAIVVLVNVI